MSTLQQAIEALELIKIKPKPKKTNIADKLLGKFRGIIPEGKTSTHFIKELRGTLYGKVKS
ncbi:MAG: hypothetical protein U9Q24_00045 [Candidatus Ratteibacteria bacterium]|nr:hypothetical protein [Candidatus Ratteibacteria bacterium]